METMLYRVLKHRHIVVRDTLVDMCYRSGISAGKEVDIRLDGGHDKPLRPADMLLYSWDGGLDVCVDLTGSSPLTQTGMVDFVPGRAVIDAAQRKRDKYMAKCADIGYEFLPFSFSSLEELEADAVTLLSGSESVPIFSVSKPCSIAPKSLRGIFMETMLYHVPVLLVCRKLEGKKYELARKLKINVVNHRWVEDCVKQGRRVSERPYMKHCGLVIGPLLLEIPVAANEVRSVLREASASTSYFKNRVIDVESDDGGDDDWTRSSLLKENLLPDERRNKDPSRLKRKGTKRRLRRDGSFTNEYVESDDDDDDDDNWTQSSLLKENLLSDERRNKDRSRLSRKGTKRGSRPDVSLTDKYDLDESPSFGLSRIESENLTCPSSSHRVNKKKRDIPRCESSKGSRRLMCKNADNVVKSSSDAEDDFQHTEIYDKDVDIGEPSKYSKRHYQTRIPDYAKRRNLILEDSEQIEDLGTSDLRDLACNNGVSASLSKNSLDKSTKVDDESNEREDTPASPTPIHLSCVICWTDFSSTRGVLPCGHRFCFSCIQNWADHMASMKKVSKCPLCKASFYSIQKMEEAVSSEQKIYSQTIPNDSFATDVYIIPHGEASARTRIQYMPPPRPVCYQCSCREPEELLINCHSCEHRCVHSYCMDPPQTTWVCVQCKDLRMRYFR
ncbi:BRCT domain-containing protein [Tanacetum coccineum]